MMSKTNGITERVFEAIKRLEMQGYPPTIREVGKAVGLNHAGIWRHHIRILLETGRLAWPKDPTGRRVIRGMRTVAGPEEELEDEAKNDL